MHVHESHPRTSHPQNFLAIAVNLCLLFSSLAFSIFACTKNVFDFFPFNFFFVEPAGDSLPYIPHTSAHICACEKKWHKKTFGETIKKTFHAVSGALLQITSLFSQLPFYLAAEMCHTCLPFHGARRKLMFQSFRRVCTFLRETDFELIP